MRPSLLTIGHSSHTESRLIAQSRKRRANIQGSVERSGRFSTSQSGIANRSAELVALMPDAILASGNPAVAARHYSRRYCDQPAFHGRASFLLGGLKYHLQEFDRATPACMQLCFF